MSYMFHDAHEFNKDLSWNVSDVSNMMGMFANALAFNGDITKKDLRDKSNLYNTYVIKSLPPTPISMPTKSSLDAAIMNSPNAYLFFVADGEGKHIFSKTYNEHLEYVNLYQKK